MRVNLLYGKRGLEVEVPDGNLYRLVEKGRMPLLRDPERELRRRLEEPIGTKPLRELASRAGDACVVVCDITRPVPNKLILPAILEELERGGIGREDITLLVATGTHRPNTGDELVELVGEGVAKDYRILNHCSFKEGEVDYLGRTDQGTPVYINKIYTRSELKVVTGLVEPHFMAGYSGGRKCICPGLASIETIRHIHGTKFLESPQAANCIIEGNPIHEELTKIARMAGADFSVNAIIDERRDVAGLFCGEIEESHRTAIKSFERYFVFDLEEKVDIVLTTSAGYPLDKTYYQAVKGLVGALGILKEGGTIVLAAECSEGLGSENFSRCLEDLRGYTSYGDYIENISKPENFVVDQWEVEELIKVLKVADVMLYSGGLRPGDFKRTFTTRIRSVEEGLELALKKHGPRSKIAVIPEGPYIVPRVGR
ncbi:MAG: nickel-dependent lactate racemase [bacterium]